MELTKMYLCLMLMGMSIHLVSSRKEESREACISEEFKAECPRGHVIMMTGARYGRLRLGRCIKKDFGWLGCSVDVMSMADRRCSGRRQCTIDIFKTFGELKPCSELESSFSASYKCVLVSNLQASCRKQHDEKIVESGVLSSFDVFSQSVPPHCPYMLNAKPGQRWNITLVDFATTASFSSLVQNNKDMASDARSPVCQRYAVISEGEGRRVVVCGGDAREKTVYVSQSNRVSIQVYTSRVAKDSAQFLLKYQAIGCENPYPSDGMKMTRDAHTVKFVCNATQESWMLTCHNGQWMGEVGICEFEPEWSMWSVLTKEDWATPYGILIVTGLGVALGVIIGFSLLIVALFCIKKKQREKQAHKSTGFDDITAYRNHSIGKDYHSDNHNLTEYQTASLHRHKMSGQNTYKARQPLPIPPPPHSHHHGPNSPLPPAPSTGPGGEVAPPPYPAPPPDVDASGYGTTGRYGVGYHPTSNSSASSSDHVYEIPN